jgi:hypothetical protein
MAEGTTHAGGLVTADPEALRAEMAKTRAALTSELGLLKSRVLGTPGPAREGTETMATKTQKGKSASAAKKKAGGTKSKQGAASKAAGKVKKPAGKKKAKKTASKAGTKAKKVLGEALAGAAVGAVKGAAEKVVEETGGPSEQGQQPKKAGRKKSAK